MRGVRKVGMNWWDKEKYNKIGRVYGRLTVKKQVSTKGHRRYKCKCVCGKFTEASANNLVTGRVISCGCALKGCNRGRPYEWLYGCLTRNAKLRKRKIDIRYEDFVKFCDIKTCHYCEAPVLWKEYSYAGYSGAAYNLDRKDNSLGYLLSNVVVCCTRCNISKGNRFTYEEWLQIGKLIKCLNRKKVSPCEV